MSIAERDLRDSGSNSKPGGRRHLTLVPILPSDQPILGTPPATGNITELTAFEDLAPPGQRAVYTTRSHAGEAGSSVVGFRQRQPRAGGLTELDVFVDGDHRQSFLGARVHYPDPQNPSRVETIVTLKY